MKIPGINYNTAVQSPGRIDVGAIARSAQGRQAIVGAVGDVADQFYVDESKVQATKGRMDYQDEMEDLIRNRQPYDTDDEGNEIGNAWSDSNKRYETIEKDLRDRALSKMDTPLAKREFNEKADQLSQKHSAIWAGQALKWQKEEAVTTLYSTVSDDLKSARFTEARETIESGEALNLVGPGEQKKLTDEVNYSEVYFDLGNEASQILDPAQAMEFKQKVAANGELKEVDKNRVIAKVESQIYDVHNNNFRSLMDTAVDEIGLRAAIERGEDTLMDGVRQPADNFGGDEKFKRNVMNSLRSQLSFYRAALDKQNDESLRGMNKDRLVAGVDMSSPTYNKVPAADRFGIDIMGWQAEGAKAYDKSEGYGDRDLVANKDGIRDRTTWLAIEQGYMPLQADEVFNAAIYDTRGSREAMFTRRTNAVTPYFLLSQENMAAVDALGKDNRIGKIVSLASAVGGAGEASIRTAVELEERYEQLSIQDKKDFKSAAGGSEFSEFVEKEMDGAIRDKMGAGDARLGLQIAGWKVFGQADAKVQAHYRNRVTDLAKYFYPLTGGDSDLALKAAVSRLDGEFGISQINGEAEFMHRPPEKFVKDWNKGDGKWGPEQLVSEVKKNFGEDYDTSFLKILPVPGGEKNGSPYYVLDMNPERPARRLGDKMFFDYGESSQYREEQAESEANMAAADKALETAQKRAAWDEKYSGVSARDIPSDGTDFVGGVAANPYGRAPGTSPINKIASAPAALGAFVSNFNSASRRLYTYKPPKTKQDFIREMEQQRKNEELKKRIRRGDVTLPGMPSR